MEEKTTANQYGTGDENSFAHVTKFLSAVPCVEKCMTSKIKVHDSYIYDVEIFSLYTIEVE